ncbi:MULTISPECIES: response regulator [Pseudofrankia]|uniref:response regulator n=1 Tax=Pseudofrankia TaxID=2994363 RepID=UPI000234CE74|nr:MULTISPECIES: response regulator [Pseudofrankia]OHV31305.1 two-component system response regulator [Pseudofrankia sp. EUN1h]
MIASRPYRVLLVEDDEADALLIEEALEERGMVREVRRACDGADALDQLNQSNNNDHPDLIVLDLNMPRMNGREFLAQMKADPRLQAIPVVVLTTSASPGDVTSAYQNHANAYVKKPVDLDEFSAAVQRIDTFFLDTAQPYRT